MVNKLKFSAPEASPDRGRKWALITTLKRSERDYLIGLVSLLTQSKTIQELASPALLAFLTAKPWLKKGWEWPQGKGYWTMVDGVRKPQEGPDGFVSYAPKIVSFALPDGQIVSGEALVNQLDQIASEHCLKSNGQPNKQRVSYGFITWMITDLYPPKKYARLIPAAVNPVSVSEAPEELLVGDKTAITKASPRLMLPKGKDALGGVTVTVKLSPTERATYKRLGGVAYLRAILAEKATVNELKLDERARKAYLGR